MPIPITGLFEPSDGIHGFDLIDPQDISAGNVNVVLQAVAGGAFKGGSHATAPVGEVVVQRRTDTGAPTHSASEGTLCWNTTDNKFYVNNDGSTGWTELAPAVHNHDSTYLKLDGTGTMAGNIAMGTNKVTGLGTPTGGSDATTKDYVDALANGLDWKASVRVATTAAGTLATSFENGDTIDGIVLATGDRILIKNQAAGAENGIYVVAASGAPTRAADANVSAKVTSGMSCLVSEGTTNADKVFVLTTNDPITLDTTALVFAQLAGGSYTHPNHTGDVTSVGDGATTIAADAVTFAKMANIATDRLIGRDTAATGDPEALTVGGGIEFSGSGGIQTSAFTGDVTKAAAGTALTIAADSVTYAKMQNVSATDKVLGRSTAGAGDPEEIACTAAGRALLDDADAAAQRTTLGLTNVPTRTLFLSAQSGRGCATSGGGDAYRRPETTETTTNDVNYWYLAYDQTTAEKCFWQIIMPDSYAGGTVLAKAHWTAASGSGGVAWGVRARMFGDDDALDQAFGTQVIVTDTLIATGDEHITAATGAITIGGTPAGGKLMIVEVQRVVADAADTLTADARLIGLVIEYVTSSQSD